MNDLRVLTQAVGDLDEAKVLKILNEFVASDPGLKEATAVVNACQQGMAIVGDLFEKNEYFVGDLIFAGELLTSAIDLLKPVLGKENGEENLAKIGKVVLGTVKGDLHDIGKNIFKSMSMAAGFEVYDLGIDVPPSDFVEKVKEIQPEIVGMSGVLTLSLNSMKETVDALEVAGLRNQIKIIIGGNPVTKDACNYIGADMFTTNAAEGIKICRGWIEK